MGTLTNGRKFRIFVTVINGILGIMPGFLKRKAKTGKKARF
jgi:hypothetical protein